MKWPRMRYWAYGILVAVAGTLLLSQFSFAFFVWSSTCRICGAEQQSHKVFWIPMHRVIPTRLSRYLDSIGYAKHHTHEWLAAHGGGGPALCAIGPGRKLWRVVEDKDVVDFLMAMRAYRSQSDFENSVHRLLDPQAQNGLQPPWYSFTLGEKPTKKAFDEWAADWDNFQQLAVDGGDSVGKNSKQADPLNYHSSGTSPAEPAMLPKASSSR